MLLRGSPDLLARRRLVDRAADLRAAMVSVGSAWPGVLGEVSERWLAARRAADPAAAAYQHAWRALPYRDRLARRLEREWFRTADMLLWHGQMGFQTAEDVAYAYLRRLPTDSCPRSAPADVRVLINAALRLPALARAR